MKIEAPPNVLGISGLGSLQHVLQKKHWEALDYIKTLESHVRDLEAELEMTKANSNSIADMATMNVRKSKIEALEAERVRMKEEWDIQRSQIEHLRAERDRLKAEVDRQKKLDLSGECDRLRARHAALVETASKVCLCRMNYSKRGVNPALDEYAAMMQSITELADVVKAALAEVKG